MKIKSDHITNSSSSSFIVAFDKLPETAEEMRKILFDENQILFKSPYVFDDKDVEGWAVEDVAEIVFEQTKLALADDVLDELCEIADDDWEQFEDADGKLDWVALRKHRRNVAEEKMKHLIKNDWKNKLVCIYEYSDNDGELQTAMEHGNLFRRLPHIRISKH